MFDFISTLSESKLIPSTSTLKKYDVKELRELVVLYVCGLYILYCDNKTENFAIQYAKRTLAHGSQFEDWQTNSTDLYVILHGLKAKDAASDHKHIPLNGEPQLVKWLKEMSSDRLQPNTHKMLFSQIDFNFKVNNSSIRAVRRLIMDWRDLDSEEHSLAMTRLLQLFRARALKGEIFQQLQHVADHHDWELADVCDKETGIGCGDTITFKVGKDKKEKKSGSLLLTLAGAAVGLAAAKALSKKD